MGIFDHFVAGVGNAIRDVREKVAEEGWFGRVVTDGPEAKPEEPPEHSGSLFRYASTMPWPKPEPDVIRETYTPEAEVIPPSRPSTDQDAWHRPGQQPELPPPRDDRPGIEFDSR